MVGSLKKGSKQSTMSLPASAAANNSSYNTLPNHHHLRTSTSSPRFIKNVGQSSSSHLVSAHKPTITDALPISCLITLCCLSIISQSHHTVIHNAPLGVINNINRRILNQ